MNQNPGGDGGQKILVVGSEADMVAAGLAKPELLVPAEVADARKEQELDLARGLSRTRENRRRRGRKGEEVPMACSVCKNGRTTLYNKTVLGGEVQKRCGDHR